jgi:hypothetical protein
LPLFARGSILSATDVYLAMSHGAEGVFVDNAIFKSGGRDETIARLKDIVTAASCGCDIDRLSEVFSFFLLWFNVIYDFESDPCMSRNLFRRIAPTLSKIASDCRDDPCSGCSKRTPVLC